MKESKEKKTSFLHSKHHVMYWIPLKFLRNSSNPNNGMPVQRMFSVPSHLIGEMMKA